MEKKLNQVYIVGAGISGLIAAHVLEKQGISPTVIESSDRVGGRLKTDLIKGFQLDHGFQVLLSNYSAAKKYLDYQTLNLQKLKAGACIFIDGKQVFFGDPLRDPRQLFTKLFSAIGTESDKIKIAKHNFKLKKKNN
jgi:phytoene dehydrogenase-like protein